MVNCDTDAESRKPAHFAWFRVLNRGATEEEKTIYRLISSRDDDFKLEFGLSPVLSATLGQYDWNDQLRPGLEEILKLSRTLADLEGFIDWHSIEKKHANTSPLHL